MFTKAQYDFLNNKDEGKDTWTLGAHILIGDPSLIVGGYDQSQPSDPETNPSSQPISGQSTPTSKPGGSAPTNI